MDGEGNIFSLCVSPHLGGYPIQQTGGYPLPRSGQLVPHPVDRGIPPSQVWMGGAPSSWWGYPLARLGQGGTPSSWRGYPRVPPIQIQAGYPLAGVPHPGLDRGTPSSWGGAPIQVQVGVPQGTLLAVVPPSKSLQLLLEVEKLPIFESL